MNRFWAGCGAVNALIAVAAGAFGAHALKQHLSVDRLNIFDTGARYQMYHALGLFAVAFVVDQGRPARAAGWAMLGGIVLFSGSLYALALTGIRGFGAITPIGGLGFLAGWAMLAWSCFRS